jgi:alkylation response protein AidB-like acyl-CoA dehydrogenase
MAVMTAADPTRLAGGPAGLDTLRGLARRDAVAGERAARLTDAVADALRASGALRAFVPTDLGGPGLDLPSAARLTAAVAEADPATGWVQQLCAGPAWFIGAMPPALAAAVFARPDAWVAGSGMPGRAVVSAHDPDVVEVTGSWGWCSGAPWASALTLAVELVGHGPAVAVVDLTSGAAGGPTLAFDDTDTDLRGLAAAANWRAVLDAHPIPRDHVFAIAGPQRDDPLFRVPFLPFAEVSMTAAVVGMARGLVAEFAALASTKVPMRASAPLVTDPTVRQVAAPAVAALRSAEGAFWDAVDGLWAATLAAAPGPDATTAVLLAALHAVDTAVTAADRLAALAGTDALSPTAPLARGVAGIRAARTNAVISPRRWADAADALWGPVA